MSPSSTTGNPIETPSLNASRPPFAFRTRTYDWPLPQARIAQVPAAQREDSRLLVIPRSTSGPQVFQSRAIPDLKTLLRPGDLLVLNQTQVRKARLPGTRSATGGKAEALILDIGGAGDQLKILLGTRGKAAPGELFSFDEGQCEIQLVSPLGEGAWQAKVRTSPQSLAEAMARVGRLPLPPYIKRGRTEDPQDELDEDRYQTVFASKPGAAAAPTAGLHFSEDLLADLKGLGIEQCFITLHVGLGTFRPVGTDDIRLHPMHEEHFELSREASDAIAACKARRGRVVAVGTTVVRVLESLALRTDLPGPLPTGASKTDLFLHPPRRLKLTDAMITNFHSPQSTLFMLVSAFAGLQRMHAAYRYAIREDYRFLSYGDACFIS